jgi:ABC-type transporter Mla MlaB component
MLRITTDMTERAATLTLEGRLAGIWVSELERCWQTVRTTRQGQSICIDLRELIFVDAAGKQLLAEMYRNGADLVAAGCWMKGVVEDIATSEVRRAIASRAIASAATPSEAQRRKR